MIVILIIGIFVDLVFFGTLERAIRPARGLLLEQLTALRAAPPPPSGGPAVHRDVRLGIVGQLDHTRWQVAIDQVCQ